MGIRCGFLYNSNIASPTLFSIGQVVYPQGCHCGLLSAHWGNRHRPINSWLHKIINQLVCYFYYNNVPNFPCFS